MMKTDNHALFQQTTENIRISVVPQFIDAQSDPLKPLFVWAYTVVIENLGQEAVTLRHRHWLITDANAITQEVRGEGGNRRATTFARKAGLSLH